MMCGVCPIPASNGKTEGDLLNRGGTAIGTRVAGLATLLSVMTLL